MLHIHYPGKPAELANLLQAGFEVDALVGCTLREFLCIEMEICGDYANKRIQTIFIDGTAVDDFDLARINQGSRLALSGAMPGLVGAVMRRGGVLGGLRDSITYRSDELRPTEMQGRVTIRLYNFIAEELAHIFLRRGVFFESEKLVAFMASRSSGATGFLFRNDAGEWEELTPEKLEQLAKPGEQIRLDGAVDADPAPAQQAGAS